MVPFPHLCGLKCIIWTDMILCGLMYPWDQTTVSPQRVVLATCLRTGKAKPYPEDVKTGFFFNRNCPMWRTLPQETCWFFESAGLRSVKVWIFSDTSSSRELSSWTCTACHSLHAHATHESIVPTLGRQDRLFEGSSKQQEFQKNIYFCFIDYAKAFDSVDHNKLWKILKDVGIPDHLTCLLRNLYAGQEATVRTGRGTTDWFQIGKGVHQGCMLLPCLFNLHAEYIMRNAGLEEARLELREISITSDMQMTPPIWQKVKKN